MPQMNQSLSILTGCSAGATEAIVVVPFELRSYALSTCLAQLSLLRLVKIRLQDKASTYAGPADVAEDYRLRRRLGNVQWNGIHLLAVSVLSLKEEVLKKQWSHVMWSIVVP